MEFDKHWEACENKVDGMLWIALLLLVVLVVWVHCARGMSVKDRIDIAMDIVRSSNFTVAEGFTNATKEDPELVGWIKAGHDCIMLFRSVQGKDVKEIVDFASDSFHPGLVIHYVNGTAVRAGKNEVHDARARKRAAELLSNVRRMMHVPQPAEEFGYRY